MCRSGCWCGSMRLGEREVEAWGIKGASDILWGADCPLLGGKAPKLTFTFAPPGRHLSVGNYLFVGPCVR